MKTYSFIITTARPKGIWLCPALYFGKGTWSIDFSLKFFKKEITLTYYKDK